MLASFDETQQRFLATTKVDLHLTRLATEQRTHRDPILDPVLATFFSIVNKNVTDPDQGGHILILSLQAARTPGAENVHHVLLHFVMRICPPQAKFFRVPCSPHALKHWFLNDFRSITRHETPKNFACGGLGNAMCSAYLQIYVYFYIGSVTIV